MKHFGVNKKKRINIFRHRAKFTVFILAFYIFGRHILLPGLMHSANSGTSRADNPISYLYALAGLDLSQVSIFSLGLGPWITAMIVWQVVNLNKSWNIQSWSFKKMDFVQKLLTLAFAILQGIAVIFMVRTGSARFLLMVDDWIFNASILMTVIAGSFVIMWLSSLNSEHGVGGSTIIIIAGIVLQFGKQIVLLVGDYIDKSNAFMVFASAILCYMFLVLVGVFFEKAEIRLPLNRILISNRYYDKSYLPVKFVPSGGMPIMYATSVIMLFQLLQEWFGRILPFKLGNLFDFTKLPSLIVYLGAIYILAILFAYINLEPEETAKRLQRQGEYFDYVQPGKATLKFLKRYVFIQSHIGAIYLVLYIGLPYFINFFISLPKFFLTLPSMLVILISMLLPLREEVKILRIGTRYHSELATKGE
ncbi:putative accessory Sec system translocase SecY2 [Streptococcus sp. oral taxon 056 str. F0418]|uniref:preprotein translocase subunit SecY n=1 Tax=Streptococcus sp. oral taxon 056 TaxID=712620 RepID=UPI0002180B80|nr:preprotein translocase subunit SecY [Streptococcus sp. oral taxon 056]EGP67100.1 putative accessory Sec system translocase SecY2 [Streptococcus sp. oral taxon 056 str. F0418]